MPAPPPWLLRSPLLGGVPGLVHGFTLRWEGRGPADAQPADWPGLARALGLGGAAWLSQVHGATVARVSGLGFAGEGDALITAERGLLLVIRVADCVPVLVQGGEEIAGIHAGWRGVAAGVVPAALAELRAPERAAVGPCISAAAYEVGEEVVDAIAAAGVPTQRFVRRDLGPRPHADLRAAVGWQLEQAGVQADIRPECTFQDERLHSFRRDGPASGRVAAVIGWLRDM